MDQAEGCIYQQQLLQEPNQKLLYGAPSSFPERPENFPIGMDIPAMNGDGFTHLGAPIGNEDFTAMNTTERVDKVKIILEPLSSLEDGH